ncbi:flagellar biosynthesis protein FlgA [Acuticoccus sp. M5D2P5]|uniref:NAD(P)H-dependent oxidoreductase n=1 Tax=Acuticoccus kalidii TaxID=2910977 RepID=UPI001F3E470F|nr:flagellar biosynthesis protein FlgA [Acuticoccus kalidii]MCF3933595.1 flagellar biosynthesis protein FlgA [Acuticoccus kalidii]
MNYHAFYANADPVTTLIIGAGDFGRSFLAQSERMALLDTRVAVDLDAETAAAAFTAIGVDRARVRICTTAAEARAAWDAGHYIAASDLAVTLELPIDAVVEATGHPEAGARHARLAIEAGCHVAMVSKEVDSVVGPGLALMAKRNGVVSTPVDGDQPSLAIGLITWAETLGFEILAAGKSSEYDFVFDAARETITSNGREIAVAGFGAVERLGDRDVREIVATRSAIAAALPQRLVPDLCEMSIVANATGFLPDNPAFHAPIGRIDELPSLFALAGDGGLLSGPRSLDVFHCLRAPTEVSFAGGVFVVVRCDDAATWKLLRDKGHVVSRDGSTAALYLPRHLLGLEAATSILDAKIHGMSGGAEDPQHTVDLVMVAETDLAAGTTLHMGGHHHLVDGTSAHMVPAAPLAAENPVPFYLASNRRLIRSVAKGEPVRFGDIEIDPASELLALRKLQDRHFFGETA